MSKCDNCRLRKETAQAFDIHWLGEEDCPYDVCPEIKTNGDRIRAMSDEELAKLIGSMIDHTDCDYEGCIVKQSGLCGFPDIGCDEAAFKWLKRYAEDG